MHRAWLIAILLMGLPIVSAGSESDPEVSDPSGDSVSTRDNLAAGAADLLKAWIEEDETDFVVKILLNSAACSDPTETIEYRMELEGVQFGVDLFGTGGFCSLDQGETSATPTGAASGASFSGNYITVRVPRSAFGDPADGTELTGLYVTSKAYVGSPEAWNDSDRAPDDTVGRPYVVGGPIEEPAGPLTTYQNVTSAVLDFTANHTAPVTEVQVLNWTSPANFTLTVGGDATGFANITIDMMYGSDDRERNVTVCSCSGTINETLTAMRVDENGTLAMGLVQLRIELVDFNGTLQIHAAETVQDEAPGDGGPVDDDDHDDHDGNGTDDQDEDGNATSDPGKDSPLPVLVVMAAVLIATRRRD